MVAAGVGRGPRICDAGTGSGPPHDRHRRARPRRRPHLQRAREPAHRPRAAAHPRAARGRPGRRRRLARRHRRAGREDRRAGGRRRGTARVHVLHRAGKLGLGTAYIAGFRWALERVLRRRCRDGRRRVAPRAGPAAAPRRAAGRGPGARLALGARRYGRELAAEPAHPVPRRQHLHPDRARHPAGRRHGWVPRLPHHPAARPARSTTSRPRATASRSTWRGVRSGGALAWSRCPSRSSSGSSARPR